MVGFSQHFIISFWNIKLSLSYITFRRPQETILHSAWTWTTILDKKKGTVVRLATIINITYCPQKSRKKNEELYILSKFWARKINVRFYHHFTEQFMLKHFVQATLIFPTVGKLQILKQCESEPHRARAQQGQITCEKGETKQHLVKRSVGILLGYHLVNAVKAKAGSQKKDAVLQSKNVTGEVELTKVRRN